MSLLRAGLLGAKIAAGAAKKAIKKIKQPKIKPKKAGELYQKGKGMVGKKLKNTKPFSVRGINLKSKSRLGKGDVKVEDVSTIVDVKLPKEPAILRTNYLKRLRDKRKK